MIDKKIGKLSNADLQQSLANAVKNISMKNEEIIKLNSEIIELTENYEKKIKELENEIKKIKSSKEMFSDIKDKESKQKLILMLRAKQYSKNAIMNYIDNNAIDGIDKELVNYTIDNMKNLPSSLQEYYAKEETSFYETLKINSEGLKNRIDSIYTKNLDVLEELRDRVMSQNGDTMEVLGIITKINDVAKGINGMLGNIVEEKKEVPTINLEIQQMKNEIDRKTEDFVNFSLDNISIITDEDGIN
jgi:hypothetical protein